VNEGFHNNAQVVGRSANHFEFAFTATEVLLDFGQAYGEPGGPVLHTRIIMTPSSAKVMSQMLQQIMEQFEEMTGSTRDTQS
jgi:hypothetical protein